MQDFDRSAQGGIPISIIERIANIEASNRHNKESLADISNSLKEVVKTQHILANQKEELTKLVKVVSDMQNTMREAGEESVKHRYQIERLESDLTKQSNDIGELRRVVEKNKAHLSLIIKIGSAILLPLILSFIHSILS